MGDKEVATNKTIDAYVERIHILETALRELLNQSRTNRAYYYDVERERGRWSNERVNMTSAAELMAENALKGAS